MCRNVPGSQLRLSVSLFLVLHLDINNVDLVTSLEAMDHH